MVALLDLQRDFARALLSPSTAPLPRSLAESLSGDWLTGEARFAIHRNNLLAGLTRALADTFPVTERLVGTNFFAQVACAFLRCHPPRQARLFAYGAGFPGFLAELPDVHDLPYLPDVARLEWAFAESCHAPLLPAVDPDGLSGFLSEKAAGELRLLLQPSLRYIRSPWPIERIWEANRGDEEEIVSLSAGASHLEIRQKGDSVVYREIGTAALAFRSRLARGQPLFAALEAALASDPLFDLAAELSVLLRDGLVVACSSAVNISKES